MLIIAIFLSILGIISSIYLQNNTKRIIALNIAQNGIILFFLILAFNEAGAPPVLNNSEAYSNPLAHTLMLTAIVVSTATTFLLVSLNYD